MDMSKKSIEKKSQNGIEILKQKRERLISRFLKGEIPDFLIQHARILDGYFQNCFETSRVGLQIDIVKNPYAIIALGGYGREEQCIHSDVDLLFLFKKNIPDKAEELIREIVYPMWDINLEVGYAIRSMSKCLSLAEKDFDVLTPLLDARFVCGRSLLYTKLMEKMRQKIIAKRSHRIIKWLVEKNRKRHVYFGDSSYLLEPNLKEGQGGLRDYHTMLWVAHIKFGLKQLKNFESDGFLSRDEYRTLTHALAFIWNVRNRLHALTGRKCDQLCFEDQIKLANRLQYKKRNGQQPVESFLGELHGKMEFIKQLLLIFLHEMRYAKKGRRLGKRVPTIRFQGLEVRGKMLNFSSPEVVRQTPDLLIYIFEESARLELPLSIEARRWVKFFLYLVDDEFRNSDAAIRSFERVLTTPTPTFNVLNEMLSTVFLGAFIPEFKGIANRIQYDEYHVYPVDRHLLRTVQTLKGFGSSGDKDIPSLCRDIYKELKDRKLLLWATLLHDIGKGKPGKNHSLKGAKITRALFTRRGFQPNEVDTISFLIQEHLLLMKAATRRDINDEETALLCAKKIKDVNRLKMLYLLTVADAISTGPKAWTGWSSVLLRDLCLKVMRILEKGELASQEAVEQVEKKKKKIFRSTKQLQISGKFKELFNVMSPRYLLYTPANEILEHIQLYKSLDGADFVWNIAKISDANTRRVNICAKDRPGLFSKIAGNFTLNNFDILSTQVYTWHNHIALDIFEVKAPLDEIFETDKWVRAEKSLSAALAGRLDLASALGEKMLSFRSIAPRTSGKPNKVVVDNTSSSFFTIIEVFTYDFPGLLFCIADTIFRCRLDIRIAKIATKADQVVDVFYVRDFDGQPVDSADQENRIIGAIHEVLPVF